MADNNNLSIGSKVFIFDGNNRVYERSADGRSMGGPIYRKHFREVEITGETPRQWVTGWGKATKKDPYNTGFMTAKMVDDRVWDKDHRYKITDKINYNASTEQLREIARIIGYEHN